VSGIDYAIAGTLSLVNQDGYRPISFEGSQLVYAKTSIAGFFFDAVLRVEHNRTLRMTEHPIQTGANVVDHAFMLPAQITLEIGMSDVMASIIPGQFKAPSLGTQASSLGLGALNILTGGQAAKYAQLATGLLSAVFPQPSKSVNAYQVLKQLQGLRIPLSVTTRLDTYENMLIEQLAAPDDVRTAYGLRAIVRMRQIIVATVPTQTVPTRPQMTKTTDKGPVQSTPLANSDGSVASKIDNKGRGLYESWKKYLEGK
jgi:hypothetical protein